MKIKYIFLLFLLASINGFSQIGIGVAVPAASSELEVSSTTKGVLIPRMDEAQKNAIVSPANGLLVFQTNGVSGLYFFDTPSNSWKSISSDGWNNSGNSGTNATNNYIGTQDAQDFSIVTADIKRFTILSSTPASTAGNIGIGTTNPQEKLHIVGSGTTLFSDGFESGIGSFTTGCSGTGCQNWSVTNVAGQFNSGTQAARSGPAAPTTLTANTTNFLQYTTAALASGGKLQFDFSLNSELNGDYFRFYIDGVQQNQWSGLLAYNTVSYTLTAGAHVLRWEYAKNGSVNSGSDRVFIDNVIVSTYSAAIRIKDGTEGSNKILSSDANGNTTWINPSTLLSGTNWSTTGNSGTLSTDFVGTTNAATLQFGTNNTPKMSILSNGNVGVGVANPARRLEISADMDNLAVLRGINTNSTTANVSYGIRGQANSTLLGSAGIVGSSDNGGSNEMGVIGDFASSGTGVFGLGSGGTINDMPANPNIGIFGTVGSATGTGVYGRNSNTGATAFGVYSAGNFAETGTKSASLPTTQGNQLVYCTESPEIWFEDMGFNKLINGESHVILDELFLETIYIDATHKPHIFIQDLGDTKGLIVTMDSDNKGFTVKEKKGGISNSDFSYRILAKRRFYQNQRFGVDANQPFENNLIKAKKVPAKITDIETMTQFVEKSKKEEAVKNIESITE
ncbi:hypothetical protein [Flavobacterium sp.]|jgi:hypothetical protein|uniref:hypothetical protein n=1 Tax=Flavobacterium sp. TaxID=239 RepID=UPI0037BEEC6F